MTHRTVSCQYRDCHTLDKPKNMENPTEKRMQNEKWKVYLEPFGGCNIGDESQEFGNSNSSNKDLPVDPRMKPQPAQSTHSRPRAES